MNRSLAITLFSLLTVGSAYAKPAMSKTLEAKSELAQDRQTPWLTGSLLAPAGSVLPRGITKIAPFVFASDGLGTYNHIWQRNAATKARSINPVIHIGHGFFDIVDLTFTFQGMYNSRMGAHAIRRGDISAALGIQLFQMERKSWVPNVRFVFTQSFPFGPYQHLNPANHATDIGGSGSYESSYALVFEKLFHPGGKNFLNVKWTLGYTNPRKTTVRGFTVYGGGFGTKQRIKPGDKAIGMLSFEYTLSQSFALAWDFVGMYGAKGRPKDKSNAQTGVDQQGNPATFDLSDSYELSIAPAIEYNFSKNVGMIGGVWFPAFSNTPSYFSAVLGMNIRI